MRDKPMRTERSLQELAAQINAAHRACQGAMTEGLQHAMRAGEALLEAKARVAHGDWLPWLREHCLVSERTARAYMQVARALPAKTATVADLTFQGALKALAAPKAAPLGEEWQQIPAEGRMFAFLVQQVRAIDPGAEMSPVHLKLSPGLSREAWLEIGKLLVSVGPPGR